MKNKLIMVSLMAILNLQGSEYKKGILKNAIELALCNGQKNVNIPIIFHVFHEKYQSSYIQSLMNLQDIKKFTNKATRVLLISDTDETYNSSNNRREFVDIWLSGREWDCSAGEYHYSTENKINKTTEEKMHDDNLASLLKDGSQSLIIFNMYHSGMHPNTGRYANEINTVLNNKNTTIVTIIGPEYNGVNIEDLCKTSNINPIVFNKPEGPSINKSRDYIIIFFKNNWKIITGVSVLGLLALIYKIVR